MIEVRFQQTGESAVEKYPVEGTSSSVLHGQVALLEGPEDLRRTYESGWSLLQRVSFHVDSTKGGWCEIQKDGKPVIAHPPSRARELGCEWLAPFTEDIFPHLAKTSANRQR